MYSSKNLYNNILLFLSVLVGAFWCFFNDFTAASYVWYDFLQKYSWLELPFLWPNKIKQATVSILPSSENKDSSVFWKSKFWGSLQLLVIHFKIYFKIIAILAILAISLSFYKDSSTKLVRITFSDNPITVWLVQALTHRMFPSYSFTIIVHISQIEVCKKIMIKK